MLFSLLIPVLKSQERSDLQLQHNHTIDLFIILQLLVVWSYAISSPQDLYVF